MSAGAETYSLMDDSADTRSTPPSPPVGPTGDDLYSRIAMAQAAYFLLTGVWPLVSMQTFLKVTGPKTDLWLVKTVGVLIGVIGGALGVAAYRRQRTPEIALLAVGSALGMTAVDVVYVLKKRILPIYLLDALAEMGLIACWTYVLMEAYGKE